MEDLGYLAEELEFNLKAMGSIGEVFKGGGGLAPQHKDAVFGIRQTWSQNPSSASVWGLCAWGSHLALLIIHFLTHYEGSMI